MPLPPVRCRLERLTPCAWPDAADPPARSCAALLALAARPTFPQVGTASGLPQSMHSPISHHRAASAYNKRAPRRRLQPARLHRGGLRGKQAWQTGMVCPTDSLPHRHSAWPGSGAKYQTRRSASHEVLSLSALAGRGALDRRCQLRTGAASAFGPSDMADNDVCPTGPRPCGFSLLSIREQFSPARGDRESSRDTCQP